MNGALSTGLWLVLMAAPAIAIAQETRSSPSAQEIEKRILGDRQSISQGHVVITTETDSLIGGERREIGRARTEIWFDQTLMRSDIRKNRDGIKGHAYRVVSCYGPREHVYWEGEGEDGYALTAMVRNRTARIEKFPAYMIPDPRKLGLVPVTFSNLIHFGIDSLVGRADRTTPEVTNELLNGDVCWKVTYIVDKGSMRVRYWAVPSQSGGVIRAEVEYVSGNDLINESVSSKLDKSTVINSWFPKECVVRRKLSGKLVEEETIKVEVVSLGQPIAGSIFTLGGLGLPKGNSITLLDRGESKWWDGKQLINRTGLRSDRDLPSARSKGSQVLTIYVGIGFAVLAILGGFSLILRRYQLQRKR